MFNFVHHVHYVVHDRDAMVKYIEHNSNIDPESSHGLWFQLAEG